MTQQEYENKIEELENQIKELKTAKIETEQPKRWKPKCGETYCSITSEGRIWGTTWTNDVSDNWCYLVGNCFKTKKEAEEYKKQIEYTARYKNYIEEHSDPIDWEDGDQEKWFAYYAWGTERLDCDYRLSYKFPGVIYASSKEIIWDAIEEIGEDNFKKYVLRAK